jgi:hypothetical protein
MLSGQTFSKAWKVSRALQQRPICTSLPDRSIESLVLLGVIRVLSPGSLLQSHVAASPGLNTAAALRSPHSLKETARLCRTRDMTVPLRWARCLLPLWLTRPSPAAVVHRVDRGCTRSVRSRAFSMRLWRPCELLRANHAARAASHEHCCCSPCQTVGFCICVMLSVLAAPS